MLNILLFIDCSKMARIGINTRNHTKEKPYWWIPIFFFKIGKAKKVNRVSKICLCEWDMCWRNFCNFSWWLENVKSRSKIALFSNERHFETWYPKKKTITFFSGKLSKLHQKDPILHVATTFSLKQGETRKSHGPIPHPLILLKSSASCTGWVILSIPFMGWCIDLSINLTTAIDFGIKLPNKGETSRPKQMCTTSTIDPCFYQVQPLAKC